MLHLFQTILAAQKTFPRDQPHKDLVALVNFILRRFFKAVEEDSFLTVEVCTLPTIRSSCLSGSRYPFLLPRFSFSVTYRRVYANLAAIQAFFPKNRDQWKAFSSWEPPEKEKKTRTRAAKAGASELQVKRGYSWSEQLWIVMTALIEAGQASLITWTLNVGLTCFCVCAELSLMVLVLMQLIETVFTALEKKGRRGCGEEEKRGEGGERERESARRG